MSWKEERELEAMEQTIQKAEEMVADLEAKFAHPEFYAKHGHEWQELEGKLKSGREEVTRLYARWEELEAIKGGVEV